MARLIFEKAYIGASGVAANVLDTANVISGIISDSVTISEEALQVAIEDNQNVNEGYTTTMSFRTRHLDADDGTTPIANAASSSSLAYCGDQSILAKKRLHMFGINGGDDFYLDSVYVMGRRVYENGREEIEVSCQLDSTKLQIVRA